MILYLHEVKLIYLPFFLGILFTQVQATDCLCYNRASTSNLLPIFVFLVKFLPLELLNQITIFLYQKMLNLPSYVLPCIDTRLCVRYLDYILNEQDQDTLCCPS